MGKFKITAAILLSLCLLVLFAFLPGITAKIMDASQKNQAGTTEITPISLNLSPENGQVAISGHISALIYEEPRSPAGLWGRLFK